MSLYVSLICQNSHIKGSNQGSDSGEHESCEKLDKSGDSRARARKIARRTGFWIESREKNAPLADCHWLRFFYFGRKSCLLGSLCISSWGIRSIPRTRTEKFGLPEILFLSPNDGYQVIEWITAVLFHIDNFLKNQNFFVKIDWRSSKIRILADKTISPFLKIDKNGSKRKLNALTYENQKKKSRALWKNRFKIAVEMVEHGHFSEIF